MLIFWGVVYPIIYRVPSTIQTVVGLGNFWTINSSSRKLTGAPIGKDRPIVPSFFRGKPAVKLLGVLYMYPTSPTVCFPKSGYEAIHFFHSLGPILIQRWGDHLYICPDHDKCILNHSKTYVICAKKDYDMPFYHDIPCGILYYFTSYVLPCCTSFSGDIKCSIPPKAKCRLSHAILQRKRQFSQLKIGERRFLSIGKHIIFSFRFLGGFLGG